MIPLEVTNFQTGCTVVVPKSHKSKNLLIEKQKVHKDRRRTWRCFYMDGNLWHGSLPNKPILDGH